MVQQWPGLLALVPDRPRAPVDLHEHGRVVHAPCGPVDVEAVASPRAGRVLEVAQHVEALVADGERERELQPRSPR